MASVTTEYLNGLGNIYRDILSAFPRLEPTRKSGYGLAYGTLFEYLRSNYSPDEIKEACSQMERGGAVSIKNRMFVHPTELGEEIIAALTGTKAAQPHVPPFSPPPSAGE